MQVSVESTSNLGRRLTVVVPSDQLENEVITRLKNLSKTAKIEGFRPGKIPTKVIEQRFGESARGEVVNQVLRSSLNDALIQEKLEPASTPTIQSLKAEKGQPLEYVAIFEVFPEVKIKDLSDISLDKLIVNITEADVDRVLEQMRTQHAKWIPVDRKSKENDKVTVDLKWPHESKPDQFREQKAVAFILSHNLPADLNVLKGVKVGDEVQVKLALQARGSAERTQVTANGIVKEVAEPELPTLNDEFAKQLEISSMEELRKEVRRHMEQQTDQVLKSKLRNRLVEILLERHQFELPQQTVEEERQIMEQELKMQQKSAVSAQDFQIAEDVRQNLAAMAQKRVTLSLIYSAFIREYQLKVDTGRVHERIEQLVSIYENPEEMAQRILKDKATMSRLSTEVMEGQILDKLMEMIQYTEKTIDYAKVMELEPQHDHNH